MNTEETVGQRIERLRKEFDLSLDDLADLAGVSWNSLAGMESGAIRVFGPFLDPIAKVLCVTPEYILSGREGPQDEIAIFAASQFQDNRLREEFDAYARETSFRHRNLNHKELMFILEQFRYQKRMN